MEAQTDTESSSSELIENLRVTSRELWSGLDTRELIFLFVGIPALLLSVEGMIRSDYWWFANATRSSFYSTLIGQRLLSADTVVEAYLSSIAHQGATHLKQNLVGYLLCISSLYPMAILTRKKRQVAKWFFFVLIVSPLFITATCIIFPVGRQSIGFSGVLAAFYGMLPVVMVIAIDARIDVDFNAFWSIAAMFLVYTIVSVFLGSAVFVLATGGIVVGFVAWFVVKEGLHGVSEVTRVAMGPDYPMFVWSAFAILWGTVSLLQISPGVNVIAHIAGYMFGFICAYVGLGSEDADEVLPFELA